MLDEEDVLWLQHDDQWVERYPWTVETVASSYSCENILEIRRHPSPFVVTVLPSTEGNVGGPWSNKTPPCVRGLLNENSPVTTKEAESLVAKVK